MPPFPLRNRAGRALRALLAPLLAGATAAAAAPAPDRDPADVIALAVCVVDADLRAAALAQMQRGADAAAALAALQRALPDARYRRQAEQRVAEVYRQRPASLRGYVGAQLAQCVAQAAPRMNAAAADDCYQLTRLASDLFAARAAGIARDEALAALRQLAAGLGAEGTARLTRLAASVYATTVDAPDFRAGLFFHCLRPVDALQ